MSDALHFDAHAARAAGDGAHCRVQIGRRQIGHLGLRDLLGLRARQLADLVDVRLGAALFEPIAFLISTEVGGVLMMNVKLLS